MPQAAGQVKILIFQVKFFFSPMYANIFVMQGKCLFLDFLRPVGPCKPFKTSKIPLLHACFYVIYLLLSQEVRLNILCNAFEIYI